MNAGPRVRGCGGGFLRARLRNRGALRLRVCQANGSSTAISHASGSGREGGVVSEVAEMVQDVIDS
jgi:hypothetical protein